MHVAISHERTNGLLRFTKEDAMSKMLMFDFAHHWVLKRLWASEPWNRSLLIRISAPQISCSLGQLENGLILFPKQEQKILQRNPQHAFFSRPENCCDCLEVELKHFEIMVLANSMAIPFQNRSN
ncbi:hypothetical protein CEXT_461521 [Caerostris extrusa]|uniref:Uncharacterized protein n=1 Tax=Caerostris extrusa TaxID=172846 RepID=A0AAV4N068_CAEEX|nr:hypothetical protein CEXT_461521 [Caerostris extrusa]